MAIEGNHLAKIARILKKPKSTIWDHLRALVNAGILRRIDCFYPYQYEKGPKAAKMESFIIRLREGKNTSDAWGTEFDSPYYSRTHTPHPFNIEVTKLGDVCEYAFVHNQQKEYRYLFEKPYKETNGVSCYKTKLNTIYGEIPIQLHWGKWRRTLELNPLPISQTREEVDLTTNPFSSQVKEVLDYISKHAWWGFGDMYWDGTLHYAFDINFLEGIIPANVRNGHVWTDRSQGYLELETDSRDIALCIMDSSQCGEEGWKAMIRGLGLEV